MPKPGCKQPAERINSPRKSLPLLALLCALVLAVPVLSAAAQGSYGYHGATMEVTWRGTQALKLCNGLFVSNRTLDQIYAQEMVNPRPEKTVPMPLDRVEIDYKLKAVGIGVGDSNDPVPVMRAAYREGIGCVVMGIEQTFADIDKLPKLVMAPLAGDPATIPWPEGDLVKEKPLPNYVDKAALEAAGEWTFDRVGHGGDKGQVTLSLLVVHRGDIVYERYAPGVNMHTRTRTWSTAKSISSTITGIAVDQGLLKLDEPLPFDWPPDPRKGITDPRKRILLRDVLHMSSGLYPIDTYRGGASSVPISPTFRAGTRLMRRATGASSGSRAPFISTKIMTRCWESLLYGLYSGTIIPTGSSLAASSSIGSV